MPTAIAPLATSSREGRDGRCARPSRRPDVAGAGGCRCCMAPEVVAGDEPDDVVAGGDAADRVGQDRDGDRRSCEGERDDPDGDQHRAGRPADARRARGRTTAASTVARTTLVSRTAATDAAGARRRAASTSAYARNMPMPAPAGPAREPVADDLGAPRRREADGVGDARGRERHLEATGSLAAWWSPDLSMTVYAAMHGRATPSAIAGAAQPPGERGRRGSEHDARLVDGSPADRRPRAPDALADGRDHGERPGPSRRRSADGASDVRSVLD